MHGQELKKRSSEDKSGQHPSSNTQMNSDPEDSQKHVVSGRENLLLIESQSIVQADFLTSTHCRAGGNKISLLQPYSAHAACHPACTQKLVDQISESQNYPI